LSKVLHRVYFDSNDGSDEFEYQSKFAKSRADLRAIGDELQNGLRVLVYMEDLEGEATRQYDSENGYWLAKPITGTWKHP
jgi:hypothetical protein